jgi:hypothetical protein
VPPEAAADMEAERRRFRRTSVTDVGEAFEFAVGAWQEFVDLLESGLAPAYDEWINELINRNLIEYALFLVGKTPDQVDGLRNLDERFRRVTVSSPDPLSDSYAFGQGRWS